MARVKNLILAGAVAVAGLGVAGCSDADTASHNLSKDADNFKVLRRVSLYNSITDKYVVSVEGFCSIGNSDASDRVSVTCKSKGGHAGYIKDIFLKSDNTNVIVEQLGAVNVSKDHYKIVFKPEAIVPDIEVR